MSTPLTTEYLDLQLDKRLKEHGEILLQKLKEHYDPKFALIIERLDFLENKINDLEQRMNFRFSILEKEIEDIKTDLKAYSKRDIDDSNALNREVVKLQKRVHNLEEQLKKVKQKLPSNA